MLYEISCEILEDILARQDKLLAALIVIVG